MNQAEESNCQYFSFLDGKISILEVSISCAYILNVSYDYFAL